MCLNMQLYTCAVLYKDSADTSRDSTWGAVFFFLFFLQAGLEPAKMKCFFNSYAGSFGGLCRR